MSGHHFSGHSGHACCESSMGLHSNKRSGHGCQCGCQGDCCQGEGKGGFKRRFISKREQKQRLEKYVEDLKNELAGAEEALERLGT